MKTEKLKKMKTFDEMWKELEPYLSCEIGLDEGFADGKYTKSFAKFCKKVIGIDISEHYFELAKANLAQYKNVELKTMDAAKLDFPDKYFGVVFNTSFHEFDLDPKCFRIDKKLKTKMLKEMARVSDTLIFAEIDPELNISGKLYQVFDPKEDHTLRVALSNQIIDEVLPKLGYKRIVCDKAVDLIKYNSRQEFVYDMLDWWAEVKIPKNEQEKQNMLMQIEKILNENGYLNDLCFYDVFRYAVYQRQ